MLDLAVVVFYINVLIAVRAMVPSYVIPGLENPTENKDRRLSIIIEITLALWMP